MSKTEQALILEPSGELRFRGPFTDVVTSVLKLVNPTDKRVCFKIKTTAPRRYCVRPNSGIVEAGSTVNVSVMLQPFEYDPNEKNKHKFMVQTMFAPAGDIDQESLWKEASSSELMDSKLKCVFELPVDSQQGGSSKETSTKPNIKSPEVRTQSPLGKAMNITDKEYQRVMEDYKKLQLENTHLKQENTVLRDDGVHKRRTATADTQESFPSPVTKQAQSSGFPPVLYLILALLFGIILGKFVL
uniref:Vesicle-associated membrane protein/synaptobrevin-binding protein-like isoform X2 n=1 Tax=Saccoglossus kowalevskii TaxID=10224 RepID=A0ABM0MA75_SACKO|nr:PREDICTED: vesicle-associated membrane protein/synaptobrevin-binding protein-like isoform X2 [Saccoglossus kowalevskii]